MRLGGRFLDLMCNLPLLFSVTINFTSLRSTRQLLISLDYLEITNCSKGEFRTRSLVTSRLCPHLVLFFWNSAQDEQAEKSIKTANKRTHASPQIILIEFTYFLMTLART